MKCWAFHTCLSDACDDKTISAAILGDSRRHPALVTPAAGRSADSTSSVSISQRFEPSLGSVTLSGHQVRQQAIWRL